jgi:ATP-dependent DNA ligase
VLDGEIVVPRGRVFSFDDLLQRIHPAASRVKKLASGTPALLIVFDLLLDENGDILTRQPLSERRQRLEGFARVSARPQAHPPLTHNDEDRAGEEVAQASWCDPRWHHRQAP